MWCNWNFKSFHFLYTSVNKATSVTKYNDANTRKIYRVYVVSFVLNVLCMWVLVCMCVGVCVDLHWLHWLGATMFIALHCILITKLICCKCGCYFTRKLVTMFVVFIVFIIVSIIIVIVVESTTSYTEVQQHLTF